MASAPKKAPYSTYAALVGVFGIGMSGLAGVASLRGRRPEELRPLDLAILSAATFKAARTVAHDEVLSFLREPFVQGEAHEGDEKPIEDGGTRQAISELLTCALTAKASELAARRQRLETVLGPLVGGQAAADGVQLAASDLDELVDVAAVGAAPAANGRIGGGGDYGAAIRSPHCRDERARVPAQVVEELAGPRVPDPR